MAETVARATNAATNIVRYPTSFLQEWFLSIGACYLGNMLAGVTITKLLPYTGDMYSDEMRKNLVTSIGLGSAIVLNKYM